MINKVLSIVVEELNGFLKRAAKDIDTERKAVLSALVDQAGEIASSDANRVICTLVNIEQEKSTLNNLPGRNVRVNAPINLNLYLLLSSYFPGNYNEALKFLSLVIAFFQGKQVFTPANTPGLPKEVDKISLEFHSVDLHTQSQLWSALGAKMMPSATMKLRMIPITRDQILGEVTEITHIESDTMVAPNTTNNPAR